MAGFYEAEFSYVNEQLKPDGWLLHIAKIIFHADELPLRVEIIFHGWTDANAKAVGIQPRMFRTSFAVGFDSPQLLGLLAQNSEEIWSRIWSVPFIPTGSVENGQLKIEHKSLAELGAEKRPVDLLSALQAQLGGAENL